MPSTQKKSCCNSISRIHNNQYFLTCNSCQQLKHFTCLKDFALPLTELKKLGLYGLPKKWICNSCTAFILPFYSLSNNDFQNLFKNYNLNQLSSFELNDLFSNTTLDLNFSKSEDEANSLSLLNDTYLTTKDLNQLTSQKNKQFSSLCINIRSLVNPQNFSKLESLISALDVKPDVIAVNETWEKPYCFGQYKNLNGYVYISNPHLKCRGGGSGLYIRNNLVFSIISELTIMEERIYESVFVTIYFKSKPIICGTIYRSPHKKKHCFESFNKHLSYALSAINKTKHKCFIMGDFNIDLLNTNDQYTESFTDTMFNFKFYPLINKPSRISDTSSTAIDHIWTNITGSTINSAILVHNIADHFPVYQNCNLGDLVHQKQHFSRFFSLRSLQKFHAILEQVDVSPVFEEYDVDKSNALFKNLLDSEFEKCFPIKQSRKTPVGSKWFSKDLKKLLHKKDRLYKQYIATGCPNLKSKYHTVRNLYFHMINAYKKEYFRKKFIQYKCDMKKSWQCINYLLGKSTATQSSNFTLNHQGASINDPIEISNIFNDHFANVSSSLIKALPRTPIHFSDYLNSANPSSMFFFPTTTFEVKSIIFQTASKRSTSWDGIPAVAIKYLPLNFIAALTHIFNLSLSQGKFPSIFKHAKVIPLYKNKGSPKNVQNYRPISLLSNLSKVLEKVVYNRLYSFFTTFNLFSQHQFGFRHGHSTSQLITLLTEKITSAFEKKQSTLGIFFRSI